MLAFPAVDADGGGRSAAASGVAETLVGFQAIAGGGGAVHIVVGDVMETAGRTHRDVVCVFIVCWLLSGLFSKSWLQGHVLY